MSPKEEIERLSMHEDNLEMKEVLRRKRLAERLADRLIDLLKRGNAKFKIEAGYIENSEFGDDVDEYCQIHYVRRMGEHY